jgi:hypothetical protein
MPSRIVREGINTSSKINALSPLAELFYRRLMTVADDYGRFYANPATLRGACWPTCPEKVTETQILGWLSECLATANQLLIKYSSGGAEYIQIENFGQQTRGKSKFPEPTENNLLINCKANAQPSRISESYFDSRISESLVVHPPSPKSGSGTAHGSRFDLKEIPLEWQEWPAKELRWSADRAEQTFAVFGDYWRAKPGAGGRKADWFATWKNWCRREDGQAGKVQPLPFPRKQTGVEQMMALAQKRINEGRSPL